MKSKKKPRVLTAKIGLDGHDIGIRVISRLLRDAGIEVVFLGVFQTPEKVVAAALQEDVDIIGLSYLDGDHLIHTPKVLNLLKENNLNILVIVGGVIPWQDIPTLKEMWVREVFAAGSRIDPIIDSVKRMASELPE